jgi:hypothetical protein
LGFPAFRILKYPLASFEPVYTANEAKATALAIDDYWAERDAEDEEADWNGE